MKHFLNTHEAIAFLKVSRDAFYKIVKKGDIPYLSGKRYKYKLSDLKNYLYYVREIKKQKPLVKEGVECFSYTNQTFNT